MHVYMMGKICGIHVILFMGGGRLEGVAMTMFDSNLTYDLNLMQWTGDEALSMGQGRI